jgi:hypothetical protein
MGKWRSQRNSWLKMKRCSKKRSCSNSYQRLRTIPTCRNSSACRDSSCKGTRATEVDTTLAAVEEEANHLEGRRSNCPKRSENTIRSWSIKLPQEVLSQASTEATETTNSLPREHSEACSDTHPRQALLTNTEEASSYHQCLPSPHSTPLA